MEAGGCPSSHLPNTVCLFFPTLSSKATLSGLELCFWVRVKVTFRKIPPNYTIYFNPDTSIDVNQENVPSFGTLKYPPSVE